MVSKQTAPASHHSPQHGADDAEQKASSKAKMRGWEGVLISYSALPPRYFYQETTTPRFLHRFLRKVYRVGRREETVSFYISNLAPFVCVCHRRICLPVLQAVSSSKYKERARIHSQTIPEELVLLSQKSQPARRITC